MMRDVLTLVGFGVMGIFIVLGYQNFDTKQSKLDSLQVQRCRYLDNFVELKSLQNITPIVYSLEDRKIWKGQSGSGPFQRVSLESDRIINFKVFESGHIQALTEPRPMEFDLIETKDSGEDWMKLARISELDLNATLYDAIEYQGQSMVAAKYLNGERSYLRILVRSINATKWEKIFEIEIDEDTVATFSKDGIGNVYLVYSNGNSVHVVHRSVTGSFDNSVFEFKKPFYILPSSFIGAAADRNNDLRIFVNTGNANAIKPANDTRSFILTMSQDNGFKVFELASSQMAQTATHMAISEDGTISIDGIQKTSAGLSAEAFLRINYCN